MSAAPTVDRRYLFKLYPVLAQNDVLHDQRRMMADLWNALLEMIEDRFRRDQQRLRWIDAHGIPRKGVSCHVAEPFRLSKYTLQYWISDLLAECPEWRALSTWTPRRLAQSLYKAFAAFFSRAKAGAGAQSGYPRPKRRRDAIPYRFASGCKMLPRRREGCDGIADAASAREWRVTLKGVPGQLRARGCFPAAPLAYTDVDVIWRGRQWWLSVAVKLAPRLKPGIDKVTVSLDLIDEFARVERAEGPRGACDGSARASAQNPDHLNTLAGGPDNVVDAGRDAQDHRLHGDDAGRQTDNIAGADRDARALAVDHPDTVADAEDRIDEIRSAMDRRYPVKPFQRSSWRRRRELGRIARLKARAARFRRESLHVWSSSLVRMASDLTVVTCAIKDHTTSGRGTAGNWGAQVAIAAKINRHVLNQAPGAAVSMLTYKAREAGIRCDVIMRDDAPITVGRDLVTTGKLVRRAKRQIRKAAA